MLEAAKGHTFGATVTANSATCTEDGNEAYKQCETCKLYFAEDAGAYAEDGAQTNADFIIGELGHSYGTATYAWTQDAETKAWTCTATRICERDSTHVETAIANEITSEVTTEATCEGKGKTTYTAKFENVDWTTTQTKTEEDIDALGHNYTAEVTARPTQNADGTWTKGTYTYTCLRDASHTYTAEVDRADYTAFDEAVEALNGLLSNEKLTAEGKASVNNALAKAEALAKNLVVSEQSQIDELVTELNRIKAAAEDIIANSGKAQHVTEAISGLKVQFLEADEIVAIESLQLNAGGGFNPARLRLTNNNKDLPITVTSVKADKADIESVGTGAEIAVDGALDLDITAPATFNETGVITYTITYKVGSAATGYLMVQVRSCFF